MLRSTSISLTYHEMRRDRRYASPSLTVVLDGGDYRVRNWSLGGFLLDAAPAVTANGRIAGQIKVAGRVDSFSMTAEAVRRDDRAGTLACRFVDPTPSIVSALDDAVMARFLGRRRAARTGIGAAALALVLAAAAPASAASGGGLVPGSAPLPEFHLDFPYPLVAPMAGPSASGDLSISLDSPDHGVVQFLFSPRSSFNISTDPTTGTNRSYAGLSWNLFENNGFFGNLSLAGSYVRPGAEEMAPRALGPSLALHSTFEFGYELGNRHSLTLSLDRVTAPDFLSDRNEFDNFHLRYGLKF
jgi:hypothetical protein